MPEIPDEIKDKLVTLVAQFVIDHDIEHDAVVMFMMQVIELYEEVQSKE